MAGDREGSLPKWAAFERRILVLLALAICAFGVAQPLVWREVVNAHPPPGVNDLSNQLVVVFTVMALGLALFGIVVFRMVDQSAGNRLEREAAALSSRFQDDARNANAQLMFNLAYQSWLLYDSYWAAREYTVACEQDAEFQRMVGGAITLSRDAVNTLRKNPDPAVADRIEMMEATLAFHLATARSNRDEAIRLVDAVKDSPQVYRLENYAWVHLRFGAPGTPEWEAGVVALRNALGRDEPTAGWRELTCKRYAAVFEPSRTGPLKALGALVLPQKAGQPSPPATGSL